MSVFSIVSLFPVLSNHIHHLFSLQQTEYVVKEGDEVTHDWELAKNSLRNKFR